MTERAGVTAKVDAAADVIPRAPAGRAHPTVARW